MLNMCDKCLLRFTCHTYLNKHVKIIKCLYFIPNEDIPITKIFKQ